METCMNKDDHPIKPVQEVLLSVSKKVTFEDIRQTNEHGAEYWSARKLQPLLGYSQWRRFEKAIERAQISCAQSGNDTSNHFAGAGKMVDLGSGSVREISEYHLSRFACYLIAQNGDPRKPEIAQAQKYFAIQTHRQELNDRLIIEKAKIACKNAGQVVSDHFADVSKTIPMPKGAFVKE